jgi:hypothetical protein
LKKVVYCNFNYKCSPPTAEFKGRKNLLGEEEEEEEKRKKKNSTTMGMVD